MLEIFAFPFMQRALIAGIILAALLAILGIFVILQRMAFFADGIAHASLAGVALGIIFSVNPLIVAIILSALFALLIYLIEKKYGLASDIAIGILFTSGMALGVLLISLQPGYQPELMSFLFGNILSVGTLELWLIASFTILIGIFISVFFKHLTLMSISHDLAYVSGVKTNYLQPILYVCLAVSVVLGIKVLGIILASALLILPVATAKISAVSFKKFIIQAIIISEIIVIVGIAISYYYDLPTGPTIVLTGTSLFILKSIIYSLRHKI